MKPGWSSDDRALLRAAVVLIEAGVVAVAVWAFCVIVIALGSVS